MDIQIKPLENTFKYEKNKSQLSKALGEIKNPYKVNYDDFKPKENTWTDVLIDVGLPALAGAAAAAIGSSVASSSGAGNFVSSFGNNLANNFSNPQFTSDLLSSGLKLYRQRNAAKEQEKLAIAQAKQAQDFSRYIQERNDTIEDYKQQEADFLGSKLNAIFSKNKSKNEDDENESN